MLPAWVPWRTRAAAWGPASALSFLVFPSLSVSVCGILRWAALCLITSGPVCCTSGSQGSQQVRSTGFWQLECSNSQRTHVCTGSKNRKDVNTLKISVFAKKLVWILSRVFNKDLHEWWPVFFSFFKRLLWTLHGKTPHKSLTEIFLLQPLRFLLCAKQKKNITT